MSPYTHGDVTIRFIFVDCECMNDTLLDKLV